MTSILGGAAGGLVATIVMTAFMVLLGDDLPPPTAVFYAEYVGDGAPTDYMPQGMVLHLFYGTGAGAVFGALGDAGLFVFTPVGLTTGVLNGLVYAVVLLVGAAGFWMNLVLDMDADLRQMAMMALFHLIYGTVLGAWVGLEVLG